MIVHPRAPLQTLLLAIAGGCLPAAARETDPVGYVSYTIPTDSQRLVGVPLAGYPTFYGSVAEVTGSGLSFSGPLPTDLFRGSESAFLTVRTGTFAGLAATITAFSGNEMTLENSAAGLISSGDEIQVFANHTIADLFGTQNGFGLLEGSDPGESDTIGLWDAGSQTSRVFYFRTGEGWREAGNEAAGDQSGATVPFPTALVLNRRGPTPLTFVVSGAVPMPLEQRFFEVSTGRNLISAPFSAMDKVSDYGLFAEGSPFSVIGADSAPEADTIRFSNFSAATDSEVIYYRLGHGWRTVGADGDAGNTPVELGQSMDFQRRGPAGYIRANGISIVSNSATAARTVAVATVPIRRITPAAGGVDLEWDSTAGATYRIQSSPPGGTAWTDLGEPVTTAGKTGTAFRRPMGQGLLRILKH